MIPILLLQYMISCNKLTNINVFGTVYYSNLGKKGQIVLKFGFDP